MVCATETSTLARSFQLLHGKPVQQGMRVAMDSGESRNSCRGLLYDCGGKADMNYLSAMEAY